jgi:hypothetical protein
MPGAMRARQIRHCDNDEIADSGLVPQIAIMGWGLWVSPIRNTVVLISNTNFILLTSALFEFRWKCRETRTAILAGIGNNSHYVTACPSTTRTALSEKVDHGYPGAPIKRAASSTSSPAGL